MWFEHQDRPIDKRYRKLDGFRHVVLQVYAHLRGLGSTRQLAHATERDPVLQQTVKVEPISKSSLCEANNSLRADFFECVVIEACERWKDLLPRQLPERFGPTEAVDGSVFGCPSSMPWARYKTSSKAIKLHMSFDLIHRLPMSHKVTPAASSEREFLQDIVTPGTTYVADRGYPAVKLMQQIDAQGAFFPIRLTRSFGIKTTDRLPITGSGPDILLADRIVRFSRNRHGKGIRFRLVTFRNFKGERIRVLTNRMDLSSADIAFLYRRRWKVELFFRALKRGRLNTNRRIHWNGKSMEAVRIQLAVLILAYLLLLVATASYHGSIEIPRVFLQVIRDHLQSPQHKAKVAIIEASLHVPDGLKPCDIRT